MFSWEAHYALNVHHAIHMGFSGETADTVANLYTAIDSLGYLLVYEPAFIRHAEFVNSTDYRTLRLEIEREIASLQGELRTYGI